MRNISFALTTPQFIDGTKDVTRRVGWIFLKSGERLMAVEKSQGLGKGGKVKRLGEIEVVSVRREPLHVMLTDLDYGFDEVRREGFKDHPRYKWPSEFVIWFRQTHKMKGGDDMVTRIEFRKV